MKALYLTYLPVPKATRQLKKYSALYSFAE